MSLHNLFSIT